VYPSWTSGAVLVGALEGAALTIRGVYAVIRDGFRGIGRSIVRDLVEILCAAGLGVTESIGFSFAFAFCGAEFR
jgi:hypothetical protein